MPNLSNRKTILITAGPTIEPIDPVRYLSNYSTGKMGYELASEANKRGHKVILISGPTALEPPKGVKFIQVETAAQMKEVALGAFKGADCAVMTAAVSDFRPQFRKRKIKKLSKRTFYLTLKRNPDILSALARIKGKRLLAGYSLETNNQIKNATRKLKEKDLDIIVVNKAGNGSRPFGSGGKDVTIIDKKGAMQRLSGVSKAGIARILLDRLKALW